MARTKKLKHRLISQKKGNMNYSVDFANPSLHQPKNCPKSQSHYAANNPSIFNPRHTSFNLPNAQKRRREAKFAVQKPKEKTLHRFNPEKSKHNPNQRN
jgi:hypothetical protein